MRVSATFVLVVGVVLAVTSGAPLGAQESTGKPNIIFVLADDMREDEVSVMPKTQALLRDKGTAFSSYYDTYPLCCPSRATILTGLYAHNHGINSNRGGAGKFRDKGYEQRSVAKILKDAGYRTGLFGKYLNGYHGGHVPLGWDEWAAKVDDPHQSGEYFRYTLSENGVGVRYGTKEEDYQTDVLKAKAEAFVRESEGPFFAYVSVSAPHKPHVPAPRHKGTLGNERHETLLAVDDLIEGLVTTLEETGKLETTYVFFSSDNGWMQGEHGMRGGKMTFYEPSASVQLLVRGPGVPVGKTVEGLAGNHDLAPTFADLAGTEMPANADGRSLSPILADSQASWRKQLLLENPTTERGPYKAVVTEEGYKLVDKGKRDKLFDLGADPGEKNNLRGSADEALLKNLYGKLADLKNCSGDSCREAEDVP